MVSQNKVAIGCDHAAFDFKIQLTAFMEKLGYEVVDCGGQDICSVDYPDIAVTACGKVTSGECCCAVLLCGTGIGMSMAANKLPGIRAALCENYYSAKYTRLHNDANVICLGARVIGIELAKELLRVFLESEFEGGRHQVRVEKVNRLARQ